MERQMSKLDEKEQSLDVFTAKLKATYKLELYVARKNDVLSKHYHKNDKWDTSLIPLSNTSLHYLINTFLPPCIRNILIYVLCAFSHCSFLNIGLALFSYKYFNSLVLCFMFFLCNL